MSACLRGAALTAGAATLGVFYFLFRESLPLLARVGPGSFLTDAGWSPSEARFNIVPMLLGSFWATAGAVFLAAPLGVAAAVFHHHYAPRPLAAAGRAALWLMAGVPSVVYGFWGLVRLAPLLNDWRPPGLSLLAGILILSLMILPTAALLTDAALAAVPRSHIDGARALGLGRWTMVRRVVLPAARSGVAAAVLLATARALGETMAVIMVMGNTIQIPRGLWEPARTLTAHIALEMAYALGDHRRALFASGLALMIMVAAVMAWADAAARRREES
ncbi:MAG: phosphate ABC transporter permease subunit PstC [Elusimicrobiota bacterium]